MKSDIAVIGSGIAGLTTAALAARAGQSVILFEHHDKPGGCAGDFSINSKWGRFTFPTGATTALGLHNSELHDEIFKRLGVECQAHPIDKLRVFLPDLTLDWHHDQQKWNRERQKLAGNRFGQELFWKIQAHIADAGWFALNNKPFLPIQKPIDIAHNLKLANPKLIPMLAALPFSVGELIKHLRLENDRQFVALVNLALIITVQSEMHAAPLSNGMAGLDLWRHGAFHPVGGMGQITWKLLEGFRKWGGIAHFETKVLKVTPESGGWNIETSRDEFWAKTVVSNGSIGPTQQKPNVKQWGAFNIYAALREETVPADFPLHSQVLNSYTKQKPYFKSGDGEDIFLSFSAKDDEFSAPIGYRTLNVSTHVRLADWQNLSKTEYREKKKLWREKLLNHVKIALPDFDGGKLFIIAATPSTWEHYTLRSGVGGAPLTRRNANLRSQSVRTIFPNFYLVGDLTFPGQGTVACALSGYNAYREICGE